MTWQDSHLLNCGLVGRYLKPPEAEKPFLFEQQSIARRDASPLLRVLGAQRDAPRTTASRLRGAHAVRAPQPSAYGLLKASPKGEGFRPSPSGTVKSTRGLTRAFNHTLKYVFKGAATTVITKLKGHPLEQHYRRQLAAGTKPNLAKLTLARKIAATALAMWKNQEEYDPERHRKS